MKFSWKHFLVAFVPTLVLFILAMILVCNNAFNRRVPVHIESGEHFDNIQPSNMHIYYCDDIRDGSLLCAIAIFEDDTSGKTFAFSLEGEQLVSYEGAMYFIETLYGQKGDAFLCSLFEALCGTHADVEQVTYVRDLLSVDKKHTHMRTADVLALLEAIVFDNEIVFEELAPVLVSHDGYQFVDTEQTRRYFSVQY